MPKSNIRVVRRLLWLLTLQAKVAESFCIQKRITASNHAVMTTTLARASCGYAGSVRRRHSVASWSSSVWRIYPVSFAASVRSSATAATVRNAMLMPPRRHVAYPLRVCLPSRSPVRVSLQTMTNNECDYHHDDQVQQRTLQWVRRVVVGLNLCPFAKQPAR